MSESSIPSPCFPPPDLVAAAEDLLAKARPKELHAAACFYDSYGTLGGLMYVASDKWLPFEECSALTRARWLSVVRTSTQWGAPLRQLPSVERHGSEDAGDEGQVDPFLLGLGDIAAATKSLAEASRMAASAPHNVALGELISTTTGALHERVKALAPPHNS